MIVSFICIILFIHFSIFIIYLDYLIIFIYSFFQNLAWQLKFR